MQYIGKQTAFYICAFRIGQILQGTQNISSPRQTATVVRRRDIFNVRLVGPMVAVIRRDRNNHENLSSKPSLKKDEHKHEASAPVISLASLGQMLVFGGSR